MPLVLTLSASTIDDPDVQLHRMGTSNYACFIEDMSMLRRKDVIAQLVYEHMDRLSQNKPINDTDDSGLLRFDFVSVLSESDLLLKTNCLQPLEVNEDNKLTDTIAQHHMLFFIIIRHGMLVILSKD